MFEGGELPKALERFAEWKALSDECDSIEDFDDTERKKVKRAFAFLADEFGEGFLRRGFRERHPMPTMLINQAPWTRRWFAWFADALAEMKAHENYDALLSRLKSPAKYLEGLSVLRVSHRLATVGLRVSFDPQVDVEGKPKEPDILAVDGDTGDRIFVEVSILEESMSSRAAQETMEAITQPLDEGLPRFRWCGRIHKSLSKAHLAEVVKQVAKTCEKARARNSFETLVIDGVVELAISPEGGKEQVDEWGKPRGMRVDSFAGPPVGGDEERRIQSKIRSEQGQLPRDCAGLVVVPMNLVAITLGDLAATVAELEETVYAYPHLLGAVLTGGFVGGGEEDISHMGHHCFVRKVRHGILSEEYLFLYNRFCRVKMTPAAVTKVQLAFRQMR